jgi:DNA-binding GntR family transcriptional regulator
MSSPSKTRPNQIYDLMRMDILSGRLAPGERLPFAELSSRYQASAGVLREVLPRLVEQGLVTSEPQLGFRVVTLSETDLLELTEARVLVETTVLQQAIEHGDVAWESRLVASHHTLSRTPSSSGDGRINDEWLQSHATFHRVLLEGSPNRRLRTVAENLRNAAELYRCWSRPQAREAKRDIAEEHRRIVGAALARDKERAVAELTDHIVLTTALLLPGSPSPYHVLPKRGAVAATTETT